MSEVAEERSVQPPVVDDRASPTWEGPLPDVTVAIATYERAGYVADLLQALEQQTVGLEHFEVVVSDDGSNDDTWATLADAAASSPLRLRVLRLSRTGGNPARARNQASSRGRAPIVAFTDDDCVPTAGWIGGLLAAFGTGVDVVQGMVVAKPDELAVAGPWHKTLWVTNSSPWFETANIAYRRSVFDRLDGFDEDDGVTRRPGGQAFGEDVLLGGRAMELGAQRVFAADAVVHHRCIPGSYAEYLESRRRAVGFPALAKRSSVVRRHLVAGVFLTRRNAAFDTAVACIVLAVARRRPRWLLPTLWYVGTIWREADARSNALALSRARRLLQLSYGDAVGLAWLLRGSARHGRLVL